MKDPKISLIPEDGELPLWPNAGDNDGITEEMLTRKERPAKFKPNYYIFYGWDHYNIWDKAVRISSGGIAPEQLKRGGDILNG